MIELEKTLTECLERGKPWLTSTVQKDHPTIPRVRPIPTNMDEATRILALARNLASRTSAPAGWNPNAPVVGFSTPNPLPHQLRGGALAALQLERARKSERDRKRQREQKQEEMEKEATKEEEQDGQETSSSAVSGGDAVDAKRREVLTHEKEVKRSNSGAGQAQQRARAPVQAKPQMDVSMNLSDSSDEDDSD